MKMNGSTQTYDVPKWRKVIKTEKILNPTKKLEDVQLPSKRKRKPKREFTEQDFRVPLYFETEDKHGSLRVVLYPQVSDSSSLCTPENSHTESDPNIFRSPRKVSDDPISFMSPLLAAKADQITGWGVELSQDAPTTPIFGRKKSNTL